MVKSPRVAIIGAGVSGLRCADILTQNGAQVTIFEARDRVGGRVSLSYEFLVKGSVWLILSRLRRVKLGIIWLTCKISEIIVAGRCADVGSGPNWIHGGQNNPISVIARLTGTRLEDFDENQIVFSRDGKPMDEKLAAKVSDFVWTTIEEAFEYSNTYKDSIPSSRSLFDFFKERVEKRDKFSDGEKEACLESCRLWGSYVGDPVERQSLKFFCMEECIDSSRSPAGCLLSGGY